MRILLLIVFFVTRAFSISAQEVPPNIPPASAVRAKGGVSKLNTQKKTQGSRETKQSESPILACNQASPCFVVQEPKAQTKEQQEKADSLDTLTRGYMWATIVGVCGGLIGIGVLIWQTVLTRRSANAALLNAQAVINSERAWLVPAAKFVEPNQLPKGGLANAQVETVTVYIENCGRTPAWLMDRFVGIEVLDDTNIGQFTQMEIDGDFPKARPFPQGRTEKFSLEWTTNWADIQQIKLGEKHLFVYGFVQYRSIAGTEPSISRFCFHYFCQRNGTGGFDEGWMIDPPEENHYT